MSARILVIDDDPEIRLISRVILEAAGHEVLEADCGEVGLLSAEQERPDLIITDVMMPGIDGWAVVRLLRSKPETALTPVVFLTALSARSDRLRGFRLGADDYLPKPFQPQELTMIVQRALDSRGEISAEAEQAFIDPDLEGRLDRIGLSSLLIMLEMERKSGVLRLTSAEQICRIELSGGHPVTASMPHTCHTGAEAIFVALEWSDGGFLFKEEPIDSEDTVGLATMHLLVEGARRIDELNALEEAAELTPD